jgi:glycerol-3-phosphate acyltransferase PlsY
MQVIFPLLMILLSYVIGSTPTGPLIVKLKNGKDVREVESGRTGGTNVMRAAGFWAGLITALVDMLKGSAAVWLARALFPANPWVHVFSGLAAILGHNYSVYLFERDEDGHLRTHGGAGGATTVGAALGLWAPSTLIILPLSVLIFYFIGYASVTTMSVAVIAIGVFAYRAWIGASPWVYILYGVLAEFLLIWALRPNIRRLIEGTERMSGFRAKRRREKQST